MHKQHDFLVEIFTEELPPKMLKKLATCFEENIIAGLRDADLHFTCSRYFATPRRLAVYIEELANQQPSQKIERKGPAIAQAYDAEGKPTQACLGFIHSCGIHLSDVTTLKTDKGEWLYYEGEKHGLYTINLLGDIVKKALKNLPIPKPMYWGSHQQTFIRPVHAICMLYGEELINENLFELPSGRTTYGHRFLSKKPITLSFPNEYETQLEKQGFVIADFEKRKQLIRENIARTVDRKFSGNAHAIIDESLLDEVTALVEWPKILICDFSERFLEVPKEALISSMQGHQKCFAIADQQQKLLPHFITVSNIASENEEKIIHGNQRVMHARLSDAKFFYDTDRATTLASKAPALATITYQQKLGTLQDKVNRMTKSATTLAKQFNCNASTVARAATLCKLDLVSQMVGEFPELQGIMGEYYANHDGEERQAAEMIREHYLPKFSGDVLPSSLENSLLAIADRLDTLTGIFAINMLPTGDKDPFALRRAAIGILKIILQHNIEISIEQLIQLGISQYDSQTIENKNLSENLKDFFDDRLKAIALEYKITPDVFQAVIQINFSHIADAMNRMHAVQAFKSLEEANALASANKRVNNLLSKYGKTISGDVDHHLFEKEIEEKLANSITQKKKEILPLLEQKNYSEVLKYLSTLKLDVDQFFDEVMVMADDQAVRENRLLLLSDLRQLFLQVADIAELQ